MQGSRRVVALGGGPGLPGLIEALTPDASQLDDVERSAIATVTDDGGSSGRPRRDLGPLPPPGDLRNCLVALSDASDILRDLFQYRFSQGELEELRAMGCRVMAGDLLAEGDLARHDPAKLGRVLHPLVFSAAEIS